MVGDFVILNFVILGWWIVNPNMGALFMMVVCVWGEGGGGVPCALSLKLVRNMVET